MKRTKKPAHRAKAKPSTTSTAIARISRGAASLARSLTKRMDAIEVKTPAPLEASNVLGEEAQLGALGLVEVKLTAAEEAVLSRPVNEADVLVKPTGQPYLSHPTYTKWFNEAFGRLGWSIVPRSKPMRQSDNRKTQVVCPYVLYIHGQPAAFAMGEQEYWESNNEQTYGDALEATVASALRRCAKRLGVGLELWDKRWLATFIETRCEKVWREGKSEPSWRLKTDPPFYNERKQQSGDESRGRQESSHDQRRAPAAGNDRGRDKVISEPQLRRLWTIARRANRNEDEVHAWLKKRYALEHSRDITRGDYEEIVNWLEQSGPLPED